jgi:hypothetical protein
MRPNLVGWVLAGGFLVAGFFFALASPKTRLFGLLWVASGLIVLLVLGVLMYRARRDEGLRRNGIPGVGIIRSMTQGSMSVNNQPLMTLDLEVRPDGLPVYSVRKRMIVPEIGLGQLGIGNQLPVYVDRKNPQRIVVDWGAL